jgi:hypothetical protein
MAKKTPDELTAYQKDLTNYDESCITILKDPSYSWALPYVTGHKYRIFWDKGQLDMTNLKIEVSTRWLPTDKYVEFNLPYIDKRESIDFFTKYDYDYKRSDAKNFLLSNGSLDPKTRANWLTGYNYNDNLVKQELNFVVTGNALSSKTIQINGYRCRENIVPWCNLNPVVSACAGTPKLWSDPNSWISDAKPAGGVPKEGEDIFIPSGTALTFDLAESPIYGIITIQGCVSFLADNSKDQHLQANGIYVQTGKFNIGTKAAPYTKKAKITLYGNMDSNTITTGQLVEAGNKAIVNNGDIRMFGKNRSRMSRLTAEANKGDTKVFVEKGLDWAVGELLGFAPTGMKY